MGGGDILTVVPTGITLQVELQERIYSIVGTRICNLLLDVFTY